VKRAREARLGRELFTEVAPLETFWPAEHYHQKYSLSHREDLVRAFIDAGYDEKAFVDSTVAARLNGLIATRSYSEGDRAQLLAG
jgi:peptide-methionine (S)-S-oxide reductase